LNKQAKIIKMKSEEGKRHALPCILTARWAASPISSSRQHAIIKRFFLPCNSLFVLPLPSSTKVLKINAHLASEAVRYFQFSIKIVNDVIIVYTHILLLKIYSMLILMTLI
jgi:hypothetical protein